MYRIHGHVVGEFGAILSEMVVSISGNEREASKRLDGVQGYRTSFGFRVRHDEYEEMWTGTHRCSTVRYILTDNDARRWSTMPGSAQE